MFFSTVARSALLPPPELAQLATNSGDPPGGSAAAPSSAEQLQQLFSVLPSPWCMPDVNATLNGSAPAPRCFPVAGMLTDVGFAVSGPALVVRPAFPLCVLNQRTPTYSLTHRCARPPLRAGSCHGGQRGRLRHVVAPLAHRVRRTGEGARAPARARYQTQAD